MHYYLLASGSKGNCCIIENHDTRLVIDCGTTQKYLKNCLAEIGISISELSAMLITHQHKDHISAIKLFGNLKVYAEEVMENVNQQKIHSGDTFKIGSIHVEAIRLSHDSPCLGYILQDEDSKLVYVTDTGYLKKDYYSKLADANVYIFESNHDVGMLMKTNRPAYVKQRIIQDNGHLCNEDSARHLCALCTDKTTDIVLAHISEEGNTHEQAIKVLKNTMQEYGVEFDHIRIRAASQFAIVDDRIHA